MLFNEPKLLKCDPAPGDEFPLSSFSALQRAEIAEMREAQQFYHRYLTVSVLFNEPKLLKYEQFLIRTPALVGFSALQRAEIAEISQYTHKGGQQ